MKALTERDVAFTIDCQPEYEGPEGHFASGDDDQDAEDCANIRKELDSGNIWAWCMVTVTATLETDDGVTISGRDELHCCTYDSEDQFTEPGGYYDDMKAEALADLNRQLASIAKAVA